MESRRSERSAVYGAAGRNAVLGVWFQLWSYEYVDARTVGSNEGEGGTARVEGRSPGWRELWVLFG
jgi:hypothetical protein